jgi:hypothetical protein
MAIRTAMINRMVMRTATAIAIKRAINTTDGCFRVHP